MTAASPNRATTICRAIVAAGVLVACSNSSDSSDAPQPTESIGANESAADERATFGQPAGMGELQVTASDPIADGDADGPFLTVTVRAENSTTQEQQAPLFELHCSGNPAAGAWLNGSAYVQQGLVPAGSLSEGTVSLLVPGDDHQGAPRPACATPATVVARILRVDDNGQQADLEVVWDVPDDVVANLNDTPQPS
jgi:hypothetical protein